MALSLLSGPIALCGLCKVSLSKTVSWLARAFRRHHTRVKPVIMIAEKMPGVQFCRSHPNSGPDQAPCPTARDCASSPSGKENSKAGATRSAKASEDTDVHTPVAHSRATRASPFFAISSAARRLPEFIQNRRGHRHHQQPQQTPPAASPSAVPDTPMSTSGPAFPAALPRHEVQGTPQPTLSSPLRASIVSQAARAGDSIAASVAKASHERMSAAFKASSPGKGSPPRAAPDLLVAISLPSTPAEQLAAPARSRSLSITRPGSGSSGSLAFQQACQGARKSAATSTKWKERISSPQTPQRRKRGSSGDCVDDTQRAEQLWQQGSKAYQSKYFAAADRCYTDALLLLDSATAKDDGVDQCTGPIRQLLHSRAVARLAQVRQGLSVHWRRQLCVSYANVSAGSMSIPAMVHDANGPYPQALMLCWHLIKPDQTRGSVQGRVKEALGDCERILHLASTDGLAMMRAAVCHQRMHRLELAKQLLAQAHALPNLSSKHRTLCEERSAAVRIQIALDSLWQRLREPSSAQSVLRDAVVMAGQLHCQGPAARLPEVRLCAAAAALADSQYAAALSHAGQAGESSDEAVQLQAWWLACQAHFALCNGRSLADCAACLRKALHARDRWARAVERSRNAPVPPHVPLPDLDKVGALDAAMRRAMASKQRGNEAMSAQRHEAALVAYGAALNERTVMAPPCMAALYSNRAAALVVRCPSALTESAKWPLQPVQHPENSN